MLAQCHGISSVFMLSRSSAFLMNTPSSATARATATVVVANVAYRFYASGTAGACTLALSVIFSCI